MMARNEYQTQRVLWRELKKVLRQTKIPIDGVLADQARTGLRAADLREISGHTTKEAEAISGVSGASLLYLCDEASKLPQELGEAIEGNMASGSCKFVMISNPTQSDGFYFDAFHDKKEFWHTIRINSEDIAREIGHRNIPGMVNTEKLARWKLEWGDDSVFYVVRVKGAFIVQEQGRIVPLALLEGAYAAWEDADENDSDALDVGLDPAGAGSDMTAFSLVRGKKLLAPPSVFANLTEDAIIETFFGLLRAHRKPGEPVRLKLDAEGPLGSRMATRFLGIAQGVKDPDKAFEAYAVRVSLPARREPQLYGTVRDELYANLRRWLLDGGALPPDPKLEVEIHAGEWTQNVKGLYKATPKDDIRDKIKRSCDRLDSLMLAIWRPTRWQPVPSSESYSRASERLSESVFDPYAGISNGGRGGIFDPYRS